MGRGGVGFDRWVFLRIGLMLSTRYRVFIVWMFSVRIETSIMLIRLPESEWRVENTDMEGKESIPSFHNYRYANTRISYIE